MERSEFLQVMRFVAAALVLITHTTFYYHDRVDASLAVWHFGEIGVPIFFVISGIVMVVSTHHWSLDSQSARKFMLRRVIRIVPLWWIALGVKVAIALAQPGLVNHNHFQADHAVKSFLFIPYFSELGAVTPLHAVGWTLLHEIFFYLLFALSMLLGRRPVILTSITILVLCVAGQLVRVESPYWVVATSLSNLEFVLGMVVGTALVSGSRRAQQILVGVCVFGAILLWLPHGLRLGKSYPLLLLLAAATVWLRTLRLPERLRWMARLGDSSYSLYLFHPFIAPGMVLTMQRLMPDSPALPVLAATAVIAIALSHALHLWVEVPVVARARRLLETQPEPGRKRVSKIS